MNGHLFDEINEIRDKIANDIRDKIALENKMIYVENIDENTISAESSTNTIRPMLMKMPSLIDKHNKLSFSPPPRLKRESTHTKKSINKTAVEIIEEKNEDDNEATPKNGNYGQTDNASMAQLHRELS